MNISNLAIKIHIQIRYFIIDIWKVLMRKIIGEEKIAKIIGLPITGWLSVGIRYNKWIYKVRKTSLIKKLKSTHLYFQILSYFPFFSLIGY